MSSRKKKPDGFGNFVKSFSNEKYFPLGTKCAYCSKKLGVLETGFWSINANEIADGALCKSCAEKLKVIIRNQSVWVISKELKAAGLNRETIGRICVMTAETVRKFFEAKDEHIINKLSAYGEGYSELFNIEETYTLTPKSLGVGVARAKKLQNKMAVFGTALKGDFKKGDTVYIALDDKVIQAQILEAYVKNNEQDTIDNSLSANMGKQLIPEYSKGWLILDTEDDISDADIIFN